jgi:transcriptional regulator with XRE-family HTH domain
MPVKNRKKKPGPPKGRPLTEGANERVLRLLRRRRMTMGELARRIGASPSTLSHAFRGRKGMSLRRASLVATVLGVTLEKLTTALEAR